MFLAKDALPNGKHGAMFCLRLGIPILGIQTIGYAHSACQSIGILRAKNALTDCQNGAMLPFRASMFALVIQGRSEIVPGSQRIRMLRAYYALPDSQHSAVLLLRLRMLSLTIQLIGEVLMVANVLGCSCANHSFAKTRIWRCIDSAKEWFPISEIRSATSVSDIAAAKRCLLSVEDSNKVSKRCAWSSASG